MKFFRNDYQCNFIAHSLGICYNFEMLKELLMRKMLQSKLKGLPQNEQDKLLGMVERNPELFMRIVEETKEVIKEGKGEMDAVMEVLKNHEAEFKGLM